jgi:hypothetical protein
MLGQRAVQISLNDVRWVWQWLWQWLWQWQLASVLLSIAVVFIAVCFLFRFGGFFVFLSGLKKSRDFFFEKKKSLLGFFLIFLFF